VNFNPVNAMPSHRIGLGMMSLLPGNKEVPNSHPDAEINIVLSGKLAITLEGRTTELNPLDALYCPGGQIHAMRNHGDVPASVLWVSEAPRTRGG
jgi:quercetin dioxygenase-like cupin family protein